MFSGGSAVERVFDLVGNFFSGFLRVDDFCGELGGSSFDAVASVSGFLALSEADDTGVDKFLPFLVGCFFLLVASDTVLVVAVLHAALVVVGTGDSDSSLDEMTSGESTCLLVFLEAAVDFFGFFTTGVAVSVGSSIVFPFLFLLPAADDGTIGRAAEVVGGGGLREDLELVEEVLGEAVVVTVTGACDE